ncbi:hypothetical protein [Nocardia salmonicida]|uniref:hypothetical protein n=1 Tax=Nocardia salmonicida TaxID=53431 RepID=UPI0007A512D6|nr:hypothetical protein [Nocardia salmonicida]
MSARNAHLTPRQTRALAVLVQQRAMPVDLLSSFLGCGLSHAYETAAALRRHGLTRELTALGSGPKWVIPTRPAVTRYFGRSLPEWTPSFLWSVRGRAAAETRMTLGAVAADDWTSERELLVSSNLQGTYPYDARMLATPNPFALHAGADFAEPVWAVKVDVTRDHTAGPLAEMLERLVVQAEADGCNTVLWICAGARRPETVRTAAARIRSDLAFAAATPAELAGRPRGLRIINRTAKGA